MVIVGGWGAATDRGRVRAVNEDSYIAQPPVFVVADGMGGHAAGDVASRLAVAELAGLGTLPYISANEALERVDAANASILRVAAEDRSKQGMGTTLAGIVEVSAAGSPHWMIFNVGDSRVYRCAAGRLEQVTTDHSEAEEMVASGQITREGARSYHRRNVVTRSLGTEPGPTADTWVFPPQGAERFIICSDGLTKEVEDSAIEEAAVGVADPQALADELVRRAVEAGGHDNVTVLVVDGLPSADSDPDENTAEHPIGEGA